MSDDTNETTVRGRIVKAVREGIDAATAAYQAADVEAREQHEEELREEERRKAEQAERAREQAARDRAELEVREAVESDGVYWPGGFGGPRGAILDLRRPLRLTDD